MLELLGKNHCRPLYTMLICISITALTAAYYVEYYMKLDPCHLCIYQRIPYLIMIILSTIGLIITKFNKYNISLLIFILLSACLLAGYHSGVERGVFQADIRCKASIDIPDNLSTNEIKKMLYSKPVGSCSKPALVIFGLSMTEWNFLFNMIIFIIVVYVFLKGRKYAET